MGEEPIMGAIVIIIIIAVLGLIPIAIEPKIYEKKVTIEQNKELKEWCEQRENKEYEEFKKCKDNEKLPRTEMRHNWAKHLIYGTLIAIILTLIAIILTLILLGIAVGIEMKNDRRKEMERGDKENGNNNANNSSTRRDMRTRNSIQRTAHNNIQMPKMRNNNRQKTQIRNDK